MNKFGGARDERTETGLQLWAEAQEKGLWVHHHRHSYDDSNLRTGVT